MNQNKTITLGFFLSILAALVAVFTAAGCAKSRPGSTPTTARAYQGKQPAAARAHRAKPADPAQVQETVIAIVAEQTGVKVSDLSPRLSLVGDLRMDELDLVETVMELEDTFQISVPDEAAVKWRTIADLVDYVLKNACKVPPTTHAPVPSSRVADGFMGLPDDAERRIEDENPQIDSRLRGITVMTAVQPVDYAAYMEAKESRRIIKEERRGGFVYFATKEGRDARFANGGAAWVFITERYKAPVPGKAVR